MTAPGTSTDGTIERVVAELGKVLQPLRDSLAPDEAPAFIAELGVIVTADQARSLASTIEVLVGSVDELVAIVHDIVIAAEEEDWGGLIESTVRAIETVATIVRSIDELATRVVALPAATLSAEEFAERLFSHMLAGYLAKIPFVTEVLELAGVLVREDFNIGSIDPDQPFYTVDRFHFDVIFKWFSNPADQLQRLYQWDTDAFDGLTLLRLLDKVLATLGLPVYLDETRSPAVLDLVAIEIRPKLTVPKGFEARLKDASASTVFELEGGGWTLGLHSALALEPETRLELVPGSIELFPPEDMTVAGTLGLHYDLEAPSGPVTLIGLPGGSRLEATQIGAFIEYGFEWMSNRARGTLGVGAHVLGGRVVLDFGGADSFLQGVLPEGGLAVPFDLEMSWSTTGGLVVEGGVGIELDIPLGITIGPVSISMIHVGLAFRDQVLQLEASAAIGGVLGPFSLDIERMGLLATVSFPPGGGNLGPGDLAFDFKPPSGIGMSLDAGTVSGAGFIKLEPEIGRYSGFLSLRVSDFAVTALGLVRVNLPQPGPEYSLLILINAEFPGIQVGYGFSLNGLGGIVGVHRKIDADALRGDVANGSVSALLDPGADLTNASELLARIERYFPTAADHFVIGLSIQLRWVELVRLDIGVMIELPGPNKIVILGRARIALEADDVALVRIQIEVLGIIDFEEKLLSIDAALRDSSLLEIFQITGGAAIRLGWGERPYVVVSIGGFHPEFTPEPAVVPVPDRVGLTSGAPGDWFYLRLETYFAVTTTSLQLGAAVEVRLNLEIIIVEGGLAFDALIVFDPFYFSISFSAHFAIKVAGVSLMGVAMRGTMTGPGPVTFAGELTAEILFVEFTWSDSFSIGSEADAAPPVAESVLDRIVAELTIDRLEQEAPTSAAAILAATDEGEDLVRFDPAGTLAWRQGLTPFGVLVERLEGRPLAEPVELDVSLVDAAIAIEDSFDWFAPAAFADLSSSEALTRKSFERLPAGLVIGSGSRSISPTFTSREVAPEIYVKPDPTPRTSLGGADAIPAAAARAALGRASRTSVVVHAMFGISEEAWEVRGSAGTSTTTSETAAHQKARHGGGVAVAAGDEISVGDL